MNKGVNGGGWKERELDGLKRSIPTIIDYSIISISRSHCNDEISYIREALKLNKSRTSNNSSYKHYHSYDVIEIIDKRIKITTNTKSNIIHAIRHLQHNPSVRTYVATHRHTTSLHTLTLSVNNMNSSSSPLNSFWAVDGSVVATTRTTTSWQSSSSPTSPTTAAAAAPSPTAAIPID